MILADGEVATDVVAGTMVVSPLWLPWLHITAGMWVQTLGAIWLIVQIARALIQGAIALQTWRARRNRK